MEPQPLDFAASDARAGFRLHLAEVYNWGTFHDRIWHIAPDGDNALLTGDVGSGKSTLVDAITTLLVPAQRITYNKAAGAEAKERSLLSYVLGYYKSQRSEAGLAARPVALRTRDGFSVILGQFRNEGLDETVTLQQLGLFELLGKSLKTTNCIENLNSQLNKYTGRVKHWKSSDQRHRWVAAGLLEIEKKMRRIGNYKHLPLLRSALQQEINKRRQH